MLIVGAMAVIRYAQHPGAKRTWITRLLTRKTPKVAAVALASRNARTIWGMLGRGEPNSEPPAA